MHQSYQNLSVLIAGCGSIGKRHARLLTELGLTDLRVCDPNPQQLQSLQAEVPTVKPVKSFATGLEAQPDCVWILTPPQLHIPMAMEALQAGCHVFSEKPLCETTEEVPALEHLIAESGLKMMVGLCFRYHEGLRHAKELLDGDTIGRLVSVRALMGEHMPDIRPDFRQVWTPTGISGGAFDLIHDIDLAIWYAGQPVRRVESVFGSYSDIGIDAPDVVEVLMDFEDRCCASIHLDFFQRPRRRQIELIGTDGVIMVEFADWNTCTVSTWRQETGVWAHEQLRTDRDDMFRDEDCEFLEAVAEDKPIRCTVSEALKSAEVVTAARCRQ